MLTLTLVEADLRTPHRYCRRHRVQLVLRECSGNPLAPRPRWCCPACQGERAGRIRGGAA